MIETVSVVDGMGSGYVPGMTLEDTMRARLEEALALDNKGRGGKPRSKQQLAEDAGVDADHLRKFFRGDSGMDLEKIAAVARALGRELLWVIGGTRQLSGLSFAPVVDSSRYPVDTPGDKIQDALEAAAAGTTGPNMTADESAHWVRLHEGFGDYKVADWVLLSPKTECRYNEDIGAVALVSRRFVVGVFRLFRGEECLIVAPSELYGPGEFRKIGPVVYHLERKLVR